MLIAGPCLYCDYSEIDRIMQTAFALQDIGVDMFRCKLDGGGTAPDRYMPGVGLGGLGDLMIINEHILPACTEVQSKEQIDRCTGNLAAVWVGGRNSQNYALLADLKAFDGRVFIKRGLSMTIDEVIGLVDIMKQIHGKEVSIIERGISTFDRLPDSRWSPDLKGVIRLSHERPDIFENIIIDCSHSVGRSEYVKKTYQAFKAIGINHFMMECTIDGKSKTDQRQMLSVKELEDIIK